MEGPLVALLISCKYAFNRNSHRFLIPDYFRMNYFQVSIEPQRAVMDNECFFCKDLLVPGESNVRVTRCCLQRVHEECQDRWSIDHFICGHCRAPIAALEPVSDKFLSHVRMTQSLLDDEIILCRIAVIMGAGSDVSDENLRLAVRRYLPDLTLTIIERVDCKHGGFRPGRISSVKYLTQTDKWFVVDNSTGTPICNDTKRKGNENLHEVSERQTLRSDDTTECSIK